MGVAAHLHIRLDEYDERIRTFIPGYDAMLASAAAAARTLATPTPHIVDLGTGTGALALGCLQQTPAARLTAIDEDPDMLALAHERLTSASPSVALVRGNFTEVALPVCDALVASLALHHIRTADAKRAFYGRCRAALPLEGLLVSADCCPASDPRLRTHQFDLWRSHLRQRYSESETDGYFAAWAGEDVYFPLGEELAMLADAGFAPEVVWRGGPMAVLAARAVSS